jgi:hypothetical protein
MLKGETKTFNYTGSVQSITLPPGIYIFDAYGASGGGGVVGAHNYSSVGGMGGRATATFKILKKMTIYVYVGGAGFYGSGSSSYGGPTGGWNGGGNGGNSSSGSGGGATDFRLIGGTWNNTNSLYSRFLVAGGGGGSDNWHGTGTGAGSGDDGSGGSGGGLEGQGTWIGGSYQASYRGTQTSGYALGQGGHVTTNTDTGGAGGGWYGGKVSNNNNGGGGGGSGYIKGYNGCNTAYHDYQKNIEYYKDGSFSFNARNGNGIAKITSLTNAIDTENCIAEQESYLPLSEDRYINITVPKTLMKNKIIYYFNNKFKYSPETISIIQINKYQYQLIIPANADYNIFIEAIFNLQIRKNSDIYNDSKPYNIFDYEIFSKVLGE